MNLDFKYIEKALLDYNAKSELKQAAIIMVRNIFEEADVVHSKTPPKYAVVGCGDSANIVARRLAEKGFETILVNEDDKQPLTLNDIRPPVDIEPLILENTLPDNPFNKPQNRADRRKKARNKGKKKNR